MATLHEAEQRARLVNLFPILARTPFAIRSPDSPGFNCIAWAMGDTKDVWWPDRTSCWPIRQFGVSLKVFIAAFKAVGFEPCATPEFENGFEKIALYTRDGVPTHAARIETNMVWTSKIGMLELIEHAPDGLNGQEYGTPTHFFRRKTP